MKKLNTSPISGMLELLPLEQTMFNKYKETIQEVYRQHGFLEIETPTIDRTEILLAKAGGETEKQIYKVIKTEETIDDADQALRFDHTVPLARYVVEHENDLTFPFKVSQIGKNYRGERAQKGRFREFYQCDIDVLGRNNLPIEYDAEVITTLIEAITRLIEDECFTVRISNRKLLSGFIEERNLQEVSKNIFSIIDRSEKVTTEQTMSSLKSLNIGDGRVSELHELMNISGNLEEVQKQLDSFSCNSPLFNEGKHELYTILSLTNSLLYAMDICATVIADLKIVRGLDYYTGTVFETSISNYPKIGSVCSGGRYENLAKLYTDQILPGVGGSIGLTRLFYVLNEYGLTQNIRKPIDLVIVPLSNDEFLFAEEIAKKIRKYDVSVDIDLTNKRLSDKLKRASLIAKFGAVIGENEARYGRYLFKDFSSGEQITEEEMINYFDFKNA